MCQQTLAAARMRRMRGFQAQTLEIFETIEFQVFS
jgi:hypothetical protein